MKITCLIENTTDNDFLECEHGLSLYIESCHHKILFDTGSSDKFLKNAKKLGINLTDVDSVFLSHGHYDHGGGLKYFLEINKTAKIYISKFAFGDFYSHKPNDEYKFIGLDKLQNDRFVSVDEFLKIDDNLQILSGLSGQNFNPKLNGKLFKKINNKLVLDDFCHEQNLVISENGKNILITGCAHNGIVNIINYYNQTFGNYPNIVIGGFHLSNSSGIMNTEKSFIENLSKNLSKYDIIYYTCHCTGKNAYLKLKDLMGDKINYLSTGNIIEI